MQHYPAWKRRWFSYPQGYRNQSADETTDILAEIDHLRGVTSEQERDISGLKQLLRTRDQQQADLQAKWNFHNFKYQLLIDMWAMRVLDNESDVGA